MRIKNLTKFKTVCVALLAAQTPMTYASSSEEAKVSVELTTEYRYFFSPENANYFASDYRGDANGDLRLKYNNSYFDGAGAFLFDMHGMIDQQDSHRNIVDFNELAWRYHAQHFNGTVGMQTEFWGVTESWHLVDILNQTNVANNIDQKTKLGQAMAKASYQTGFGSFNLYVLPLFRERIFVGEHGRVKPGLNIDENLASYESSDKDKHIDAAIRYANTIGKWDFGLAQFQGTSREPLLNPTFYHQQLVLLPYYEQIKQTSIDAQRTSDSLLLKLEATSRTSDLQHTYRSFVSGFEYTQVGVFDSSADMGYLMELLYDERGDKATTPFSKDIFLAFRYIANDVAQTTYLLGTYIHQPTHGKSFRVEMTSRIRDGLTLSVEGQAFADQKPKDLLYSYHDDSYLTVGLKFFF